MGKKHKIEQAYLNYSDAMYRFIYWHCNDKHLAEDLTSEVFIRAWKHPEVFTTPDGNPRAWLYTVARHILHDHRRKHSTQLTDNNLLVSDMNASGQTAKTNDAARLLKAITTLDERLQLILILRFMEHLPVRDVAAIMQLSEADIRTMQFRALRELKRLSP
jgi:RNA polymerase sigma-70 factor (ECF subfamily)